MQTYHKQVLFDALQQLEVYPQDNILLHTSLIAFGQAPGGAECFVDDLIEYMGTKSSIFVPTFTLWLDKDEVFTLNTPSQRMGQVSEVIRMLPGAVRSVCPMHNHAAIGPLAEKLNDISGTHSTGIYSDFEIFYKYDFKNVFLGCSPTDSGTYLIHIEAMSAVPYREWVQLKRKASYVEGVIQEKNIHYFGRKKNYSGPSQKDDVGVSVDLSVLQDYLSSQRILKQVKLPYGSAYACSIKSMHDELLELLQDQPEYALKKVAKCT